MSDNKRRITDDEFEVMSFDELEGILIEKHKMFYRSYLFDFNPREAYKRVYGSDLGDMTASVNASNLLNSTKGKRYLKLLRERENCTIEENLGLSREKCISELEKIAFSSMSDLLDDWMTLKEFKSLPKKIRDAIQEVEEGSKKVFSEETGDFVTVKTVKVKLYDKRGALSDIMKSMDYLSPQKIDHLSSDGTMTPKEGKVVIKYRNIHKDE